MGNSAASGSILATSWRQDGQLGALLAASWRLFLNFGGDLAKTGENQKNDDSTSLLEVFWDPGAALGGYLGSS